MSAGFPPPRRVVLFSGHMIDGPGRKEPRFPADKEPVAADAIAKTLAKIDTDPTDLAICSGACGGDLLFAEAVIARDTVLELYIPFDEQTFLAKSVDIADANWRDRFFAAKSRATLHVMPDERGLLPEGQDPYERNNLWMLKSAYGLAPTKSNSFACGMARAAMDPGGRNTSWKKSGATRDASIGWIQGNFGPEGQLSCQNPFAS
jgi:hypothetical protein